MKASRLPVSEAWILVLIITAWVQFYRDAPFDGTVFGVAAGLLILADSGILRVSVRMRLRLRVAAAVGVAGALLVVMFPLHSTPTRAVLVVIGLLVLPYAWGGADRGSTGKASRRVFHRTADRVGRGAASDHLGAG